MTTTTAATAHGAARSGGPGDPRAAYRVTLADQARDTQVIVGRQLTRMRRSQEIVVFALVQPVMFLLLFRYVFGGAIQVPGGDYVNFLIPGIAVQTLAFASFGTALGLTTDLEQGIVDRFRSLPMARGAVVAGRIGADLVQAALVLVIIVIVGVLVGFRPTGPVLGWIAAVPLGLGIAMAFCWVAAAIALKVRTVEAVNSAALLWLFPLTFVSSAFVSTESMPTLLQAFADVNPFTIFVDAVRGLTLGGPTLEPVIGSLLWIAAITAVFAPLSARMFKRLS